MVNVLRAFRSGHRAFYKEHIYERDIKSMMNVRAIKNKNQYGKWSSPPRYQILLLLIINRMYLNSPIYK